MKKNLVVVLLAVAGVIGCSMDALAAVRTVAVPALTPAAVDPSSPASVGCKKSVSDCLADEQALTPLLMAKSTNAKLRADIREAEHPPQQAGSGSSVGLNSPLGNATLNAALAAKIKAAREGNDERLLQVGGADGVYRAYIDVGGRTVVAEPGDMLPSGWRVVSITGNGVLLSKDKKTRNLGI